MLHIFKPVAPRKKLHNVSAPCILHQPNQMTNTNKHPKHQCKKKHLATLSLKNSAKGSYKHSTLAIFFRHFRLQLRCPKFCRKFPGKWRNSAVKITALLYRFEPQYLWPWPMPLQATAAFLLMDFLKVFFHAQPPSTNRPLHPKSNLTGCYRQGDPSADGWEEATLAWASTKNSCGGVGYW